MHGIRSWALGESGRLNRPGLRLTDRLSDGRSSHFLASVEIFTPLAPLQRLTDPSLPPFLADDPLCVDYQPCTSARQRDTSAAAAAAPSSSMPRCEPGTRRIERSER